MYLPSFHTILFFLFLLSATKSTVAQEQALVPADSSKTIQIIRANSFRQKTIDSMTTLITLAGNAVVKQGNTTLSGDSIILNQRTGVAEVFGNVHINDADSVHTYAQYLKYIGNDRIAYLKKNVKLTDGKAVLNTDELEYNLQTGIAKYNKGGKVVNGKTVLTSEDAVYYDDTKDVYFKRAVHLTDPKYDIQADSLLYNTELQIATFISPTRIKTKDGIINTKSGTYNLKTGEAVFYDRTSYSDSTRSITGGKMAYDDKSGILQVEENGKLVDSVNNVTVLGGQILLDKNNASFLATRKPVMILYRKNDSTYIAGDTLFSGLRKYDSTQKRIIQINDTLKTQKAFDITDVTDSTKKKISIRQPLIRDSLNKKISTVPDSSLNNKPAKSDSIRYFLAFHHVRIYNDSIQAVSDSLHYSTEDSTFKLFGDPVFWNQQTQVNGDTMYLFTENQKAKRLFVFNIAIVINKTKEGLFNQVGGRTLNGYFKEGTIDYIRVKGTPAESIFYPQDDDSAYVGMNRSSGDVIDVYFINRELNKIKFINDVKGTLFPLSQIPADLKFLNKFIWLDHRRPKNKLELFE